MQRKHCKCGRSYASLAREYERIRQTVGPRAADDFEVKHSRHDDRDE
jgi:hypothetical protein